MWIESIEIYGFGKISNKTIRFQPGINIIEGENEAGKTTIKSFIQAIFFGFENRRNLHLRYEPLQGGKFGGAIILTNENEEYYRIERVYHHRISGDVRIHLPSGEIVSEEYLPRILQQMTDKVYNQVFSFGLNEIQQIGFLQDDQINQFLYHAGTGVGKQIQKMNEDLLKKEQELFKTGGKNPIINQLVVKMDELTERMNQIKQLNRQHSVHIEKLDFLAEEIRNIEKEIAEIKTQLSWNEKVAHYAGQYEQVKIIEWKLSQYPEKPMFPENGIQRLENIETLLQNNELDKKQLENKKLHRVKQIQLLEPMILTEEQKNEIISLQEQFPFYQQNIRKDQELKLQYKHLQENLNYNRLRKNENNTAQTKSHRNVLWPYVFPMIGLFMGAFFGWKQQWGTAGSILIFSISLGIFLLYVSRQIQDSTHHRFQTQTEAHDLRSELMESKQILSEQKRIAVTTQEIKVEIEAFKQRVHSLQTENMEMKQIEEQVYYWIQKLRQDQEHRAQLTQLNEGIREIDEELQRINDLIILHKEQMKQLFEFAQVEHKEAYYAQSENYRVYQQLLTEQKQYLFSIKNGCKTDKEYLQLTQSLENGDQGERNQQIEDQKQQLMQLEQRLKYLLEEKGKLQNQIKAVEEDTSLSRLQHEYQDYQSQLQQQMKSYLKVSTARHILQQTMRIYETEKQPGVLQAASDYFRRITANRYEQVFTPIDQAIIKVMREDKQIFEPQFLSRGTVEQLFVSMRFALIEEFSKKVRLPLLFDDIFVNFDPNRLENSFGALQQLADQHQVLYFTCHPFLSSKMKGMYHDIHIVQLN